MGQILEMDIESFSDVDLIKCGVYAYADSPAFEILLALYLEHRYSELRVPLEGFYL